MPRDLKEYIIELADRFPDMEDEDVIQAAVDYVGEMAFAYRRSIISLYTESLKIFA